MLRLADDLWQKATNKRIDVNCDLVNCETFLLVLSHCICTKHLWHWYEISSVVAGCAMYIAWVVETIKYFSEDENYLLTVFGLCPLPLPPYPHRVGLGFTPALPDSRRRLHCQSTESSMGRGDYHRWWRLISYFSGIDTALCRSCNGKLEIEIFHFRHKTVTFTFLIHGILFKFV